MRNLNFSVFLSRITLLGVLFLSLGIQAQSSLTSLAGEYSIIGALPGDQTASDVGFNAQGGWIIYQDNGIDGDGFGIGARHLNSTLSGELGLFRVNELGAGDQENPRLAMLRDGGAAFVWQGGKLGFQDIYARWMKSDGTFSGGDFKINTYTNRDQVDPAIASLNNSNVVVAWSSWAQDGDGYGVFARILSGNGTPFGSEFCLSQTTALNQTKPAVAALANGNFLAAWVSESLQIQTQSATFNGDTNEYNVIVSDSATARIFARIFDSSGAPIGGEFLVSGSATMCSTPTIAATPDGGFVIGWGQCSYNTTNSWDVFARSFSAVGNPLSASFQVNTEVYGDQYMPKVAVSGTNCFFVWTSLGQDGHAEGVYGQLVDLNGSKIGSEFRVNTTTIAGQMDPVLAKDENNNFLVVWSSYVGGAASFDLFAQRFSSGGALPAPTAPYVSALGSDSLSVTWPDLAGYSVAFYEVYVDNASTGAVVNGLKFTINGLAPSSVHSVKLLYQLTDGRRSALSGAASATTWGADLNHDGLPDDWQASNWGSNPANWPSPTADSDGDGASNLAEFLAGTNPKDPSSVLKTSVVRSGAQMSFSWNAQAGFLYQVQTSGDLSNWQDYGAPRFAHDNTDSVLLAPSGQSSFYRVIRLR